MKERILRLYARVGAVSDEELAIVRLVAREMLVSSSRFERLLGRFQRGHFPLVFATLAEGVKDGSIRADLPPEVLFFCTMAVGTMPQLLQRAFGKSMPMRALSKGGGLAERLVSVLFNGVGAVG